MNVPAIASEQSPLAATIFTFQPVLFEREWWNGGRLTVSVTGEDDLQLGTPEGRFSCFVCVPSTQ